MAYFQRSTTCCNRLQWSPSWAGSQVGKADGSGLDESEVVSDAMLRLFINIHLKARLLRARVGRPQPVLAGRLVPGSTEYLPAG